MLVTNNTYRYTMNLWHTIVFHAVNPMWNMADFTVLLGSGCSEGCVLV
jgi:hypothetical protein